jgi:hypothetical protein
MVPPGPWFEVECDSKNLLAVRYKGTSTFGPACHSSLETGRTAPPGCRTGSTSSWFHRLGSSIAHPPRRENPPRAKTKSLKRLLLTRTPPAYAHARPNALCG